MQTSGQEISGVANKSLPRPTMPKPNPAATGIALSDGGAKGSFQLVALKHLYERVFARPLLWVFAATLVATSSIACKKKAINPNDAIPPTVVIKVKKDGQYEPVTSADFKNDPLELACTVSDPDGVRSVSLSFVGSLAKTCLVSSGTVDGTFPIKLPPPQGQDLQGDASGNVLDSFTLFTVLNVPKCTYNDTEGDPKGHVITAQCVGKNWASDPTKSTVLATAEFKVP